MTVSVEALKSLFARERGTLIGRISRLVGCRDTAEDITQEAYTRLLEHAPRNSIEHPGSFVYRTARNLAVDHLRAQSIRQGPGGLSTDALLEEIPSPLPGQDAIYEGKLAIARLSAALDRLPERRRQIFLLRRLHGWRYAEIADHLGLSVSAVEKHMRLAMEACLLAVDEQETP